MKYLNKRTNILFVDDMSVCCRIFMKGLSGKYDMHWAKTRDEAFYQIDKNKYDLVVTDFELGKKAPTGGLDVIRKSYEKGLPVLAISSVNHIEEVEGLGLCEFMFKKQLFKNIERVISDILKKYRKLINNN